MFLVYIIYSSKTDRYYVGSTENIDARIIRHNSGTNKSTKAGSPDWELKHTEDFPTLSGARKRESEIKRKKSRKYIEWLIGI